MVTALRCGCPKIYLICLKTQHAIILRQRGSSPTALCALVSFPLSSTAKNNPFQTEKLNVNRSDDAVFSSFYLVLHGRGAQIPVPRSAATQY